MSDQLKQFFITEEENRATYVCVIISHSAFGDFYLVKDQIGDKVFNIDGIDRTFMGAMVKVPEESILASDDIDKGSVSFDRIGYEVLTEIKKLDNQFTLEPTVVRVLRFLEGITAPQNDYSAFVESFNFGVRNVSFNLTSQNLSKSTKNDEIFDPKFFPGLQNT